MRPVSACRCLPAVLCVMVAGCTTSVAVRNFYAADTATLERFVAMRVAENAQELERLGTVTGLYCDKGTYAAGSRDVTHPRAERRAVDQVKLKAAELGASHISRPRCEIRATGDMVNNCYGTVTCQADALTSSAR